MKAKQLFEAGCVRDAERELSNYLRDHPTDVNQRTFLFELLCFSGQYDRAEKQLGVLAEGDDKTQLGAILYYSALHAEKSRHELFRTEQYPKSSGAASASGTLNGRAFQTITDADPEIGPRLEVFAAGAYLWIPFQHISSIEIAPPRRLRDTLWAPAKVLTGPSFKDADLGEVLIPVVYPFSWKHPNQAVWLGRSTEWVGDEQNREYPLGQKVFLVDGEEVPLLEIRTVEFASADVGSTS